MPQRVGELKLTSDTPGVGDVATGLVFLLNQNAFYIRGFSYNNSQGESKYCRVLDFSQCAISR